ncbi:MAG: hypothetical protein OZ921_05265 [Sorangiineae bacterium]|nr:hypothetical protein [Polyangiaceae bacterium]MEB2321902.1 hypothetical protein [Sorangiineae bacterium]
MSSKSDTTSHTFDERTLTASAEQAIDALVGAGERALALIDAWTQRPNAEALAEAAERGAGAVRKAARRSLNVLGSRGVKAPERRRVASLGSRQAERLEAWLLAPDGDGNVLLVLTAHSPSSRYRTVFVLLHDARGIYRVENLVLSQSQLRDHLSRALPGAGYRAVPVNVEWARSRITAARARHASSGVPEPLGLTSAADLLGPAPAEPPPHPFEEEGLELALEDARELSKNSESLHGLPEFRHWFPARAALDELLVKLGEGLEPGSEPDSEVLTQRLIQEIEAATDRYFTPERRDELVRSMRDSALSVLARDGEQRALEVVAVMKVTESAGLITDPPHEIPFLRAFFNKAIAALQYEGGGQLKIPVRVKASSADTSAPAVT